MAGRPSFGVRVAKAVALVVVVPLVLFPLWTVVATSLASPQDVVANAGWVVWPEQVTLDAYTEILAGGIVTRALLVSAGVTAAGLAALG